MSFKSKNLAYEAAEPSFLRKLKGHYGAQSDRQAQVTNRPQKAKVEGGDDDEPVYVTEDGHDTISKAEYEKMGQESQKNDLEKKNGPEATDNGASVSNASDANEDDTELTPQAKEKQAVIGNASKRKIGKLVGSEEQAAKPALAQIQENKKPTVQRRKVKKVKLSFDD